MKRATLHRLLLAAFYVKSICHQTTGVVVVMVHIGEGRVAGHFEGLRSQM